VTHPNPFTTAGSAGSLVKIADLENCLCIFRPRAVDTFPTKDYGPKRATVVAIHVIYSPAGLPDPANPAAPRQATVDNPINYPELLIFNGPIQGQFRQHLNPDGASLIPGWIIKGAPLKAGQQPPWILNGELSPDAQALANQWHATFGATLPPLPPIPTPQPLPQAPAGPAGYPPAPQAPYGYPQQQVPAGYPQQPQAPYGYPQQPAPAVPQPQYAPAPAAPAYAQAPAMAPQYAPVPQAPAAVPQPQYAPAPGPAAPVAPPAGAPAPQPVAAGGVPAPPF
jgi:hypothetical protein